MFPVAALIIKSFSLLFSIEKLNCLTNDFHGKPVGQINRLRKHLFARILEENKQTNKSTFLYVQKSTDNCYLIPVDNKNSIFIPEQRKNRLNHLLKNTNRL